MLKLTKIDKRYGGKTVLNGLDLYLDGKTVALVGANGCGKTTLLKIILGEIKAGGGQIAMGKSVCGYVPQDLHFGATIGSGLEDDQIWRLKTALAEVSRTNPSTA